MILQRITKCKIFISQPMKSHEYLFREAGGAERNFSVTPISLNFLIPLFTLLLLIFSTGCTGQDKVSKSVLQPIATIPLSGVHGRIDHLAWDPATRHVFVAALGNNTVEVADLQTRKVIHSISGLKEPQGIVFIPESNKVVVANGGNGECDVFDAATFQKLYSFTPGDDADNIRYDSVSNLLYTGYGNGGISLTRASDYTILQNILFSGHPESFQLDKGTGKLFVNVPDSRQIIVIDLSTNVIVAKWPVKEATSNYPMALDVAHHRLFTGCRRPAKMLAYDTQSGQVTGSCNIDGDVDDIFFDQPSGKIFLSCGAGFVDVAGRKDDGSYQLEEKVPTRSGARTSLFLSMERLLIVALPSVTGHDAELMVFMVEK